MFQDGGSGNAANKKPLSAANARLDNGASWVRATISGTNSSVSDNLVTNPLYLSRSGIIHNTNELYYPGVGSHYWSSSSSGSTNAYNPSFNGIELYASTLNDRFFAFPLRCLHSQ